MAPDVYGLRLLRQPRMQRLALGLFVGLALLYRVLQVVGWLDQIQWGYDVSAYWSAATNLLHGGPIYSPAQLAGPYSPQQQFLYLYPPPLAVAFTPVAAAFGDYRLANWPWFGFGLVVLVGSVLAVARVEALDAPDRGWVLLRGRGRWWLVAGALAFPPVVAELVLGNVHLEILGLLTLAWLGIRRGTPTAALVGGAAIGIAALVKVFPGLLVLWLLASRRYRAAIAAVAAAAAIAVVALLATGPQAWLDYPTILANLGAPVDTTDTLAPTVWLGPLVGFGLARLVVTAAGVVLVTALGLRSRTASPNLPASFGAAVAASVLIAPAVYQHYLAILVLPLVLGLATGVRLRWLALAYLLMWGGQQSAFGDLAWIVNKGLPTLGALLLLAILVIRATGRWGAVERHGTLGPQPAN